MVGDRLVDILWIISLITNILQTNQEESRRLVTGKLNKIIDATEGDIIDFKCTDQTFMQEHYIIWYRKMDGYAEDETETEIYRNGTLLTSDLGEEALAFSLNHFNEIEFTLTITRGLEHFIHLNIYRCEVTSTGNELIDTIGFVILSVEYPPPAPYPLCNSTGYQSDLIGQNVTLTCTTQPGYPTISIEWWRNEVMVWNGNVTYYSNLRFTEYELDYAFDLQQEDLNATYQCRVTWMEDVMTCIVQETFQTTIPTPDGNTTSTNGTKESSSEVSIIIYLFAIPAVICICLLLFLICVVLKKQAGKRKSTTNGDEVHVKYSNKSKGLYRESNPMYHLSASKNQPEFMIQQDLKTSSDTRNRSDTYAQVVPKSMRNSKLQQVTEDDNGMVDNNIYEGGFEVTESQNGSLRNANMQQGKESECPSDDDHVMVENNIYGGVIDITESHNGSLRNANMRQDKQSECPSEDGNMVDNIYEGGFEVTESQNGNLRNNNMQQDKESECPSDDDHVMVENNIYEGV